MGEIELKPMDMAYKIFPDAEDDGGAIVINNGGLRYAFVRGWEEALNTRSPDTVTVRAEEAAGATIEDMRRNLSYDMRQSGDCRLMWVNQGDLTAHRLRSLAKGE